MSALSQLTPSPAPVLISEPRYRGLKTTPIRPHPVDIAWSSGDLDQTLIEVIDLVRTLYGTSEPYSTTEFIDDVADRTALKVLRSLPGYKGALRPLKEYNGTIPLSHFTRLKAKQTHIELLRSCAAAMRNTTLACELVTPEARNPIKKTTDHHAATDSAAPDQSIVALVGQTVSRLSDAQWAVIQGNPDSSQFLNMMAWVRGHIAYRHKGCSRAVYSSPRRTVATIERYYGSLSQLRKVYKNAGQPSRQA